MPSKIIGKSTLGELGFCQYVPTMGGKYQEQWEKVLKKLPRFYRPIMTSMTGMKERTESDNEYIPRIRLYDPEIDNMFNPLVIYQNCLDGIDFMRPGADFIMWGPEYKAVGLTFSKDAPIISFTSTNGCKAIGTILRPALMEHGYYLFGNIMKGMETIGGEGKITVTLETSTFFKYEDGSIPYVAEKMAKIFNMSFICGEDTRRNPECYHKEEKGNHIVALW